MLSEEKLELMAERVYERLHGVNSFYLEKIGNRLKQIGNLDEQSEHQLKSLLMWKIEDVKQIESRLASETGWALKDCKEILEIVAEDVLNDTKQIYNEKGFDFVALKKNKVLYELVEDIIASTFGEIENLTKTTALSETYKKALNEASTKAIAGLESYTSANESICRELAENGIYKITYDKNGKSYSRRVDTSARQAILSSMKQVNLKMSERLGKDLEADGWQISYHSNPRPSHREIGGQIYTIEEFEAAGIQTKLDDFGCLHFKMPFWFGISTPSYSPEELTRLKKEDTKKFNINGKEIDRYEVSQIQRRIENEIRKNADLKFLAQKSGNKKLELETKGKITKLKKEYRQISEKSGLPMKTERFKVVLNKN